MRIPLAAVTFQTVGGVAESKKTISLNHSVFMRSLILDIAFSITWVAGGVTVFTDAQARSLRFELFLDGSGATFACRGDTFKNWNELVNEVGDDYTEISGAAGAQTGSWRCVIPFADPRLPNPDDTAYDLALAPDAHLDVFFDGLAALTATALGNSSLTSITVTATIDGVQRPDNLPAQQTRIIRRWKEYAAGTTAGFPAGGTDAEYNLDVGVLARRYMVVVRESTSATRAYVNSAVSAFQFEVNSVRDGKMTFDAWRTQTRQEKRIAPPTGIVFLEFDKSSTLAEVNPQTGVPDVNACTLNLVGANRAKLLFDMAAALANGLELRVFEERVQYPA